MFLITIIALVECKSIAFLRHGIRSPNDYSKLDKQLWGEFPPGFLTEKGFDQVRQMAINNFTIHDEQGFCDYSKLRMISSVKPRVMRSVIAFVTGLCPQNYKDILAQYFRDYYQQYSTNQTNFKNIANSDFTDPLSLNFDSFQMKPDFMFHGHKSENCPLIDVLDDAIYSSKEYDEINKLFQQHKSFKRMFKLYQQCNGGAQTEESITITQLKKFYSSVLCNEAEGIYDYHLDSEEEEYLMSIFKFQYYGIDYSQSLQHQSTLTHLLKWLFEEVYTESEWSFFYGHDDNQYALLSVITNEQLYIKFAGRLIFEIKDTKVNVMLDDQILITKFCKQGVDCLLTDAISYLNRFVNVDLEKDCQFVRA